MPEYMCPYCELDSAGRHDALCPAMARTYTLSSSPLENVTPYPNVIIRNDWIWCQDQLPEGNKPVLICQQYDTPLRRARTTSHISIAEYRPEYDEWWKVGRVGYAMTNIAVVAWQPLPEPPSEEQIAAYVARTANQSLGKDTQP